MGEEYLQHRNCINDNGDSLVHKLTNYGEFPETYKLILVVKSLQNIVLYEAGNFIIPGKRKGGRKLNLEKLRNKIYPSTK